MRDNLGLYSLKERIFLVKSFYKSDSNLKCVKSKFLLEYGNDFPSDSLIFEVINLFEETGSVRELPDVSCQEEKVFTVDNPLITAEREVLEDVKIKPDPDDSGQVEKQENIVDAVEKVRRNAKRVPKVEATSVQQAKPSRGKKAYICDICAAKYGTKRGLQAHMVCHRRAEIPCKECEQTFPTKSRLLAHTRATHSAAKKDKPTIECSFCCKTFRQPNLLRQHMLRHSDKKDIICEICGKTFKRTHTLNHHMKVHTGEKPYKCDVPDCGRAFRDRNSFAIHKRCHTDERPFPCHYCGKCFRDKGTLRIHYRQHTGENPYKCELCGKETKQKQNLKSHMRHFHRLDGYEIK
ncbi:zinc finger protein 567-like [Phlebotomus argentipes]|uniref:zinc finger protein 567-like n=1 Tax=Phlebotomus argentipes TaxID=94469 RepID=UPI00289309B4|nr:zinc finger protein 567-like [Phlebotomus argentipes]